MKCLFNKTCVSSQAKTAFIQLVSSPLLATTKRKHRNISVAVQVSLITRTECQSMDYDMVFWYYFNKSI